ncbi:MAG: DoxX family protein [Planctomycetota bacterium]
MTDRNEASKNEGQPKWMTVTGWVLTVGVAAMLAMSAIGKLAGAEAVQEQLVEHLGFTTESARAIGIIELVCVVFFVIPQTRVLGATLIAAYLGGAVCAHLRVGDPVDQIAPAIVIGGVAWLALVFRDRAIRRLTPVARG